jgi:peptidoglycan/LPS O-acetylase OafA/YrhL
LPLGPIVATVVATLKRPTDLPLDELKGLGLILVLWYHTCGVLHRPDWSHAQIGVDIFLLISGFAVTASARRRSLGDFFRRRFLRIFPAYWFAIALFVGLDWWCKGVAHSWHSVLLHALGLHAFGPEFDFWDINMSFWFLALLVPMYGCVLFFRDYRGSIATIVAWGLTLGGVSSLIYDQIGFHGHVEHLTVRIPSFFVGIAAASWSAASTDQRRPNLFLGAALLFVLWLDFARGYYFHYPLLGILVVLAYLGLHGLFARLRLAWLLAGEGVFSYEIFLLHQPFIIEYALILEQKFFPVATRACQTPGWGVAIGFGLTAIIAVPLHLLLRLLFRSTFDRNRLPPGGARPGSLH